MKLHEYFGWETSKVVIDGETYYMVRDSKISNYDTRYYYNESDMEAAPEERQFDKNGKMTPETLKTMEQNSIRMRKYEKKCVAIQAAHDEQYGHLKKINEFLKQMENAKFRFYIEELEDWDCVVDGQVAFFKLDGEQRNAHAIFKNSPGDITKKTKIIWHFPSKTIKFVENSGLDYIDMDGEEIDSLDCTSNLPPSVGAIIYHEIPEPVFPNAPKLK